MTDDLLRDHRILVAEDEYLLASDLSKILQEAGVEVVGPCATLQDAVVCAEGDDKLDAAVLDVNLRGEMVFPLADTLMARGVPFLFATGYDEGAIPPRFAGVLRLEKPIKMAKVREALKSLNVAERNH